MRKIPMESRGKGKAPPLAGTSALRGTGVRVANPRAGVMPPKAQGTPTFGAKPARAGIVPPPVRAPKPPRQAMGAGLPTRVPAKARPKRRDQF